MIGSLLIAPSSDPARYSQQARTVVDGITLGSSNGTFSVADQEVILSAASSTKGGNGIFVKNLVAVAAPALVVGAIAGYFLARKKR